MNAGIFESDYDVVLQLVAQPKSSLAQGVSLQKLAELQGDTGYDQLLEAHNNMQNSKADVVVGRHDEFYHMAAVKLNVPYVMTSMLENNVTGTAFYMMPRPTILCNLIEKLLTVRGWRRASVIYEQTLDTAILNQLVGNIDLDLKFGRLPTPATEDDVKTLLLRFRTHKVTEFLVLTTATMTRTVLLQARRLGIVAVPQSWLLLNLGSLNVSTDILDDLHTNITTINLVREHSNGTFLPGVDTLHQAILDDALAAISATRSVSPTITDTITKRLKQVDFVGNTGRVVFDEAGWRTDLCLSVYHRPIGPFLMGWNYTANRLVQVTLNMTVAIQDAMFRHTVTPLKGKTVKVVTIMERPFCMYNEDKSLTGNDRFYGFTVDMMEEISKMVQFKYTLHPVRDGNFGARLPNGTWNGIIGEILDGHADMSFAPLSINAARESAIDFSKPFKTRGVNVVMKTPESQSSYFQFMKPLSSAVWVCTLLTMCLVTVMLYTYEKYSLACRNDMPKLNIRESLWFIFGSLVQGSTESAPVTIPGRIITSAWWFFSLILISTYTANLAAFLTVKKINPPISSITDLAGQSKIAFGTVVNSGVENFFKNTRVEPFSRMWEQMSTVYPAAMVNTTEDGLKKVKEGNYAFLWDSTVTSYVAAQNCGFTAIGPTFDHKGFGMGVPPGAVYLEELSMAILRLGDQGKIAQIENKFWGEESCDEYTDPSTDETSALLLESAAGMFFVLLGGVALGAAALGAERLLRKLRIIHKKSKPRPPMNIVDLRK